MWEAMPSQKPHFGVAYDDFMCFFIGLLQQRQKLLVLGIQKLEVEERKISAHKRSDLVAQIQQLRRSQERISEILSACGSKPIST